jgi:glycine hydroxymethyltransferase
LNPSGIRLGTAAITTMGANEDDMRLIVGLIDEIFKSHENQEKLEEIQQVVKRLMIKLSVKL